MKKIHIKYKSCSKKSEIFRIQSRIGHCGQKTRNGHLGNDLIPVYFQQMRFGPQSMS